MGWPRTLPKSALYMRVFLVRPQAASQLMALSLARIYNKTVHECGMQELLYMTRNAFGLSSQHQHSPAFLGNHAWTMLGPRLDHA
jgi:hypothetical protein